MPTPHNASGSRTRPHAFTHGTSRAFLVDCLRAPRQASGYSSYGYDVYLPNIVVDYIVEIEASTEHRSMILNGSRSRRLSPLFYEAAWELSRRGTLRPGVREFGGQATDGIAEGYSVTARGREWLNNVAGGVLVLLEPTRLARAFKALASKLRSGFLQRATEASRCHVFGLNLACCAMCGAAAESILLAVAITKSGDEEATMRLYRTSQGRRKVTDLVIGSTERDCRSVAECHELAVILERRRRTRGGIKNLRDRGT